MGAAHAAKLVQAAPCQFSPQS